MRGIRIEPTSVTIHDYAYELETLKNEVGGEIDMITLPDGGVMIVDRDFVLKNYPLNENASAVAGFASGVLSGRRTRKRIYRARTGKTQRLYKNFRNV